MGTDTSLKPVFCQYASGPCDQDLSSLPQRHGFFVYPSEPATHARTCKAAVEELQRFGGRNAWLSWEELSISGQIIFCEICKAIRSSQTIVGDVTNLNFNVLFELGFALGLRKPILPARDTTFVAEYLTALGFFDVLGYISFHNSRDLSSNVQSSTPRYPFSAAEVPRNQRHPIYYVKGHVESDGSIKIGSCLKKGYFRFRQFDPQETQRLSLHDAYRQVMSSVGVVAHLVAPARSDSAIHNGRAAFICGMAMAAEKRVLMIQEGFGHQPIDYRDVVRHYEDPKAIPNILEPFFQSVAEEYQPETSIRVGGDGILGQLDLGDVAAENEIESLRHYFVRTPQFQQTVQGHTQVVVGRKGSGKTAIFFGLRQVLRRNKNVLILDLKPDGHQLVKLREEVLKALSEGFKEHTLTVFWEYLLLLEITSHLLDRDLKSAYADPLKLERYQRLEEVYREHVPDDAGDFSERILTLVDRVIGRFRERPEGKAIRTSEITGWIYSEDIARLRDGIREYLHRSEDVWILFDNIDKGWPALGATAEDVAIVRSLLDASRSLQRTFEQRGQDLKSVVFLRKDVYDLLVNATSDRGKEAAVNLDWSDVELVKSLILERISASSGLSGDFQDVWIRVFEPHVKGTDSFRYILDRTFMRPRDVLNFTRLAVQIAVSRGREKVEEQDLLAAERSFSEGMRDDLRLEIRDVFPRYPDLLSAFAGANRELGDDEVRIALTVANVDEADHEEVLNALLWFAFLGVSREMDRYSYQVAYSLDRLKAVEPNPGYRRYVIHPAFHTALDIRGD